MKDQFNVIIRKTILLTVAIVIIALGVSLLFALKIGTDPVSVFVDGEHHLTNLDYGTVTTINNSVLVVFGLLFAREYLHIGSVIGAFLMGPLINTFVAMFNSLLINSLGLIIKLILLFPAVAMLGFGVAMLISIDFGVGTFELLTLKIRDVTKFKIKWVKMGVDFFFTAVGFLMGGIIGAGTIVGVLLTGPMVSLSLPHTKRIAQRFKVIEAAN